MGLTADICQGLLVAVLLVSATSKLRTRAAFEDFARSLRDSGLVRPRLVRSCAIALVSAESTTAALLLVPQTRRVGFVAAALLFAVLTAGVAVIMRRGRRVTCRCFGVSSAPLGTRHISRNALLLAAAVLGALGGAVHLTPTAVAAVLIGAVLAVPVVMLDDLRALFGPPARPMARR